MSPSCRSGAPRRLSTPSASVAASRANLGLINAHTDDALKLVNDVRAVFAHAEEPITFRSRYIEEVAGKDARRRFDEAASRAERAIEERRNRIVYERTCSP